MRQFDCMINLILRFIFWITGWKINRQLPDYGKKCVMVASPHTSNWDFVYMRAGFSKLGIPVQFTVKDSWMKGIQGFFMKSLGGIGINRRPKKEGEERPSMTQAMIDLFNEQEELVIVVTPEGTRSLRTEWKTGFYHVAKGAGVPITLGYLDFENKIAGVGKVIWPSDDMEKDLREIMEFYKDIKGKHPEKFSIDKKYLN